MSFYDRRPLIHRCECRRPHQPQHRGDEDHQEYVSNVKAAPEEIKYLAIQAEALSEILAKLRDDAAEDVFQPDSYLFSVLKHCDSQLRRLCEKLNHWRLQEAVWALCEIDLLDGHWRGRNE